MLIHWIWLSLLPGLSLRQKAALLKKCPDPEELYQAPEEALRAMQADPAPFENKDLTQARNILGLCKDQRIGILTYADAAYPPRLKNIEEPPLVLYYQGLLPDWQSVPVIGVVGTRKASSYGLQMAEELANQIALSGALMISGGAAGIDAKAMTGALSAGMPTAAILGCGVDVVYPKSNEALFAKTRQEGCLISEYPPGTPAFSWNFPRRNRIISGISNGVLIVEAPQVSGALNTARHALEQGRDVYVVPGNINVDTCAGSNQLLKEGAVPVFTGWDVVKEYEALYPGMVHRVYAPVPAKVAAPREVKKAVDNPAKSHYSGIENPLPALSQEEKILLSHISAEPKNIDAVLAEAGIPAGKALSLLTVLALKGVVVNHPGKRISLK